MLEKKPLIILRQSGDLQEKIEYTLVSNPLKNLQKPRFFQRWNEPKLSLTKQSLDYRRKVPANVSSPQIEATYYLAGKGTMLSDDHQSKTGKLNDNHYEYKYLNISGTAFAISSKVLITSAHSIAQKRSAAMSLAVISPPTTEEEVKIYAVEDAYTFPKYDRFNDFENDFGILVLKDSLPIRAARYVLFPNAFERLRVDRLVCDTFSYPADKGSLEMWYDQRLVFKQENIPITTNYSFYGESGSPVSVIDRVTGYPLVIAVHSSGWKPKNLGFQVAALMTEIDMEKIQFIKSVLPAKLFHQLYIL